MILAQHHEYPTTRYPRYHGDHSDDHNHDQQLVLNSDHSDDHNHDNTWSQTVIIPAITTNLSPHRTGVVINQVIINTVDSRWDRHELGLYPRAQLSIDLIYTLQR